LAHGRINDILPKHEVDPMRKECSQGISEAEGALPVLPKLQRFELDPEIDVTAFGVEVVSDG